MKHASFPLHNVHPSWQDCLKRGLAKLDPTYLAHLMQSNDWLPGHHNIFNAFSLPLQNVNYVLFGESPYPRRESANGYAFWDAAVKELWSSTGLSKKVNRATSLRNLIKMLLLAEGVLDKRHLTQEAISTLNKQALVQTNEELFQHFLQQGFLLLNATPVLQAHSPHKDARAWYPFTQEVLAHLQHTRPHVKWILFGRIANTIDQWLPPHQTDKLYAEHPYNHSFITNPKVLAFFKPLHLLIKKSAPY